MVFAASTIVGSNVTVITGRVMIWWARIGTSAGSQLKPMVDRLFQPARRDLGQGTAGFVDLMELNVNDETRSYP